MAGSPTSKTSPTILDLIEELRTLDLGGSIDLPLLVACGDQSSGKSSVLEAISGVRFPTKDVLCTRFATELVMRKGPSHLLKASIIPGPDRDDEQRLQLQSFSYNCEKLDQVGEIISAAETAMGLGEANAFSRDVLKIEVTGPQLLSMTMVDLPGLFHTAGPGQTTADADNVKQLVKDYMGRPNSIILAVISAKQEFVSQIVMRFAEQADPGGKRTLGIITKPDAIDGDNQKRLFLNIALNHSHHLRLGWHVVRNRSYAEADHTPERRNQAETDFLSCRPWDKVTSDRKGALSLQRRLADIFFDRVLETLPGLTTEIATEIARVEAELTKFGSRRQGEKIRAQLYALGDRFSRWVVSASGGQTSGEPGWKALLKEARDVVDLRRALEDVLQKFHQKLHHEGHAFEIVKGGRGQIAPGFDNAPASVSFSQLSTQVADEVELASGMPGQFQVSVVSDLFYQKAARWPNLVKDFTSEVEHTLHRGLLRILVAVSASQGLSSSGIWDVVVLPAWANLFNHFRRFLQDVMPKFHEKPHPVITLSTATTDQIAEARRQGIKSLQQEKLQSCVQLHGSIPRDLDVLLAALTLNAKEATDDLVSAEVIQCAELHYKEEREALEHACSFRTLQSHILSSLPQLLSQQVIDALNPSQLKKIDSVSSDCSAEVDRLRSRLKQLKGASVKLKDFAGGQQARKRGERDSSGSPVTSSPSAKRPRQS